MRRTKLVIITTCLVVAVATVVIFAAGAAARRHDAARHRQPAKASSVVTGDHSRHHDGLHSDSKPHGGSSSHSSTADKSPIASGLTAARSMLPTLTPMQLAGQRVIYSYTGQTVPSGLLQLISHGEAAGVIFFSDNVGTTAAQLATFKKDVIQLKQAAASSSNPVREPLLLMTDQEGGEVRRLPGRPVLSEKQIGESKDPVAAATRAGNGAAATMLSFGLNTNLAPVLDVFRQPGNFIDQFQRSYSNDPHKVSLLGTAFVKAQQGSGVAATVKHFPGLGAAATNQNTDLGPVTLNVSLSQIRGIDELPYQSVIAAKVKLVMLSWAIYPALDKHNPAGLSSTIVQGELRQRLGFAGVTITDALEAGALNPFGSIASRATLASNAGMDLLLCSQRNFREGLAATTQLAADYQKDGPTAQAAFKAAVARVIALRTTLHS